MEIGYLLSMGCGRFSFQSDIFPKELQKYKEAMFIEWLMGLLVSLAGDVAVGNGVPD